MGKYLFEYWASDKSLTARSGQKTPTVPIPITEFFGKFALKRTSAATFPISSSVNLTITTDWTYMFAMKMGGTQGNHLIYLGTTPGSISTTFITTYYFLSLTWPVIYFSVNGVQYLFTFPTSLPKLVRGKDYFSVLKYFKGELYLSVNGSPYYKSNATPQSHQIPTGIVSTAYNYSTPGGGYCQFTFFHNGIVSEIEIQKRYKEWLNQKQVNLPTQFKPNLNLSKSHIIDDNGLIAAYNFKVSGNKILNIAAPNVANGWNPIQYDINNIKKINITPEGICSTKHTLPKIYIPVDLYKGTLCMYFKFIKTSSALNGLIDTSYCYVRSSNGVAFEYATHAQVANFPVKLNIFYGNNTWNNLIIRFDNSTKTSSVFINGIYLGSYVTTSLLRFENIRLFADDINGYDGIFSDFRVYNRLLTDKECINYHNSFLSKPILNEKFDYPIGAIRFGNWQVKSGSWRIEELSQQDNILDFLKKGTKILKCISDGLIMLPISNPYGIYEFTVYWSNNYSGQRVGFQSYSNKNNTGYQFGTYQGDKTLLLKDGGDIKALSSFNTVGYPYRYKIIRDYNGAFKIYVKGGIFGKNYTLWNTNLSGTNPVIDISYTGSNLKFMFLNFYAGSWITDIVYYNGIKI